MAAAAASSSSLLLIVAVAVAVVAVMSHVAHAKHNGGGLSWGFYDETCPSAHDVVRRVIQDACVADPRIPASLIRLHFHDCLVNNCTAGRPADALDNLDDVTPDVFDNNYYGSLLHGVGKLPSDQVMLSDPYAATTTAPVVHRFAGNQKDFFRSFAASMIKMGNISPLTGTMNGEIRHNCRRINTRGY
ncbi:hypothetical protein ABZP36_028302 [Zizania latifolia]